MIVTNNFSNFISKFNNAVCINKNIIVFKFTYKIINLLKFFLKKGFVKSFKVDKLSNKIIIFLLDKNNYLFHRIKQISKKNQSIFLNKNEIKKLEGIYVISTKYGYMLNSDIVNIGIGGKIIIKLCFK